MGCHDGLLNPVVNNKRGPPFLAVSKRNVVKENPSKDACRTDESLSCSSVGCMGNDVTLVHCLSVVTLSIMSGHSPDGT